MKLSALDVLVWLPSLKVLLVNDFYGSQKEREELKRSARDDGVKSAVEDKHTVHQDQVHVNTSSDI